jgi:hypothetical protein
MSTALHNICFCSLQRETLNKDGLDIVEATANKENGFVLPSVKKQGDHFSNLP